MRRLDLRHLVLLTLPAALLWVSADLAEAQVQRQRQAVAQIDPNVAAALVDPLKSEVENLKTEVENLRTEVEKLRLTYAQHRHSLNHGESIYYLSVKEIYPGTTLADGFIVPMCLVNPCVRKVTSPPE